MADYTYLTKTLQKKSVNPTKNMSPTNITNIANTATNSVTSNPLVSQTLLDLCNYRIQQEEYSARLYLAMSYWLENKGYFGAAKLWRKYSDEETSHAGKFYDYLLRFGIQPIVPVLEQPQQTFMSLMDIVELSYQHEIEVYNQCKELALAAFNEQDLMLYPLALQFTAEQSEEISKLINWKDMFESFGTTPDVLLMIDKTMGED